MTTRAEQLHSQGAVSSLAVFSQQGPALPASHRGFLDSDKVAGIAMSLTAWSLTFGLLLLSMLLVDSFLRRLPISAAMIYLVVGYLLGPGAFAVIDIDPLAHAETIERLTECGLLISLFAAGLKLGAPMRDRIWALPLRLAFPSMVLTVGMIAAAGYLLLGLSVGQGVLLGAILAPTDPVLASGIAPGGGKSPEVVRFGLSGEGALNDGTAFPFVLLGLGLEGMHPLGLYALHWWTIDLLWSMAGGLVIGALLGWAVGMLVVFVRTRFGPSLGLNEFLSLGLIAICYGVATFFVASSFLAVFAAGLALQRVRENPLVVDAANDSSAEPFSLSTRFAESHHASAAMNRGVQQFNSQLEKLAEMAVVLLIGTMLPYAEASRSLLWFLPLIFLAIRPIAVWAGTIGLGLPFDRRVVIGWFGIRGIGSIFYLSFVMRRGELEAIGGLLTSLTMWTVVTSIVVHGVTVLPFMTRRSK